jgi:dienelactone hydrolase
MPGNRIAAAALLALALALPAAAHAAPPLEAYGRLPAIEQIAISPSGDLLAIDLIKGDQHNVVIQSLSARKIVTGFRTGDAKIRGMLFAGDGHLIFTSSETGRIADILGDRSEHFFANDFDIARQKLTPLLTDSDGTLNAIAGSPTVRVIGGKPVLFVDGVHMVNTSTGGNVMVHTGMLALFRINLDGDHSDLVVQGDRTSGGFFVGADGRPLAETEYDAIGKRWALKVWQGGGWREAESRSAAIETPYLMGLGRDGQSVLIGQLEGDAYTLRELSPDGKLSDPIVPAAAQQYATIHDPVTHALIGIAGMDGDAMRYRFFSARDQGQWDAIVAAFDGRNVELVSSSDDRKILIVHIDSRTDGPGYVLVDLRRGATQWLGPDYPQIAATEIGTQRPIRFKARDGLDLSGYLTLPPGAAASKLPLVVFPHGGPAARDAPGFNWWAQAMASRGYAVLQVNYRGSAGFGWAFQSAGFGEWGGKMQTDLSDGVKYLADQGIVDAKRVCIVGASYGGYAALAGAAFDPGVYRCAVDVEGPAEIGKFIAWSKAHYGDEGYQTQRYWDRYMGASSLADPRLAAISPADHAANIAVPLLIIHGKDDTVVPFEQSQMMADAMKAADRPYDLVVLNHEDHWLSRPDTRLQMLQATIDFLQKNNPSN